MTGDFDRLAAEAAAFDSEAAIVGAATVAVDAPDVDEAGLLALTMQALEWAHAGMGAVLSDRPESTPYLDAYGADAREKIARGAVAVMIKRGITSPGQILEWLGKYSAEVSFVMAAMGPGVLLWMRKRREAKDAEKTLEVRNG